MMIGLVTEEEEEGGEEEEGKSHCKVGTRWVRQTLKMFDQDTFKMFDQDRFKIFDQLTFKMFDEGTCRTNRKTSSSAPSVLHPQLAETNQTKNIRHWDDSF